MSESKIRYDPKRELHRMTVDAVLERLVGFGVNLVVISGGEPLNQQVRLLPLVDELVDRGIEVEIETNGTRIPHPRLIRAGVRFNVSPKLAHAGGPVDKRIVDPALRTFAGQPTAAFKFVCRDHLDLEEVADLVERFGLRPVWIMPEGRDRVAVDKHIGQLAQSVIDHGWNLTTRLHTLIWGECRGV